MWRHYRKFFREISEVIVYEVQSPTISMFFWQFRMTQAIFRNALQKNALKTFSLNIHKYLPRQESMPERFSSLSSQDCPFFAPLLCCHIKRKIQKDGSSPSNPPQLLLSHTPPLTDLKCWVVTQNSKLCPVCFNIFSLGRVP